MNKPVLTQALIRLEGSLKTIPVGFERPRKDLTDLFVHEIEINADGNEDPFDSILCDLKNIRGILSHLVSSGDVKSFLHLDMSVDELDFATFRIPERLSKVLSEMLIELEVTVLAV